MDNGTRDQLLGRLAEAIESVTTAHPVRVAGAQPDPSRHGRPGSSPAPAHPRPDSTLAAPPDIRTIGRDLSRPMSACRLDFEPSVVR